MVNSLQKSPQNNTSLICLSECSYIRNPNLSKTFNLWPISITQSKIVKEALTHFKRQHTSIQSHAAVKSWAVLIQGKSITITNKNDRSCNFLQVALNQCRLVSNRNDGASIIHSFSDEPSCDWFCPVYPWCAPHVFFYEQGKC